MRNFIIKVLGASVPVLCAILYYNIAIQPHRHGDLGKLGFIPFDDTYDASINDQALDSMYVIEANHIDQVRCDSSILTFGDSFSQRKRYGYQNYLATLYPGYTVYNLLPGYNYQFIVDLLTHRKDLPDMIVIETVERYLVDRLAHMDFNRSLAQYEMSIRPDTLSPHPSRFKNSTYYQQCKRFYHNVKNPICHTQEYLKKKFGLSNPVRHLEMAHPLFSCQGASSDLYFYHEDLLAPSDAAIQQSYLKLDTLFSLAAKRHIRCVLLVASDKYHLYKPFATQDPYQTKGQLELFSRYEHDARFLNSRSLLAPHLDAEEKDIYLCNDTHWSIFAARYVAEEIKRRFDIQTRQEANP